MPKYIAFLRAINVGGHTVKMDTLRQLFIDLGFTGVETFIASGNVIFETGESNLPAMAALESRIEQHLNERLGYPVKTFLRTPAGLEQIAQYQPYPAGDLENPANTLYIGFLQSPPGPEATQRIAALSDPLNQLHIHDRELYWLVQGGIGRSEITGARLEKALGMPTTLRNVNTIKRLIAKVSTDEP